MTDTMSSMVDTLQGFDFDDFEWDNLKTAEENVKTKLADEKVCNSHRL